MRKIFLLTFILASCLISQAARHEVKSPDGKLVVTVDDANGELRYAARYNHKPMLLPSRLGLVTDMGNLSRGLTITGARTSSIDRSYKLQRSKCSEVNYKASVLSLDVANKDGVRMTVTFNVSNNDIAFRYTLPEQNDTHKVRIDRELSAFRFPDSTSTFLTPQALPLSGWKHSKPSYEENYRADLPMTERSEFGVGYTFPCLFRIGDDNWALVSETGVTSDYCGSRLSDYDAAEGYTIAFPQEGENNGVGSSSPAFGLTGSTPWRTITLGESLKPIVETTIPFDLVEPLYKASTDYRPGRYTWSWLIWQDESINYDDQVRFIDVAAAMGFEYCLVDASWDQNIGRKRMAELSRYAMGKGVRLMLWYNSNGLANDAPQTPRNIINNPIRRKQEMAWLRSIGAAGIKVDFFGGDKQETMRLYEEILTDANDYGLQVIFHGATIPRGWERMYPNFVGSEACLASENVYFTEEHALKEGFEMSMHPFCRNSVASFDWGGVMLNRYMSKDNHSRHQRYTSDMFEIATAITNQCSINCVALTPNNLTDVAQWELDLIKSLPTTWDETRYIDGYPGCYAVIARRHGNRWYVGAINGTDMVLDLEISLPMLAGKTLTLSTDKPRKKSELLPAAKQKTVRVKADGSLNLVLQPMGGALLTE